jgi:hypothetical protein
MALFAEKMLRKLGGNWTFVVIIDRHELDDQVAVTFAATGALTRDIKTHVLDDEAGRGHAAPDCCGRSPAAASCPGCRQTGTDQGRRKQRCHRPIGRAPRRA